MILGVELLTRGERKGGREKGGGRRLIDRGTRSHRRSVEEVSIRVPSSSSPPGRGGGARECTIVSLHKHDQSMSRREVFHPRCDKNFPPISRPTGGVRGLRPRIRVHGITSPSPLQLPPSAALHYVPPNEEVSSGYLSAHEYHIHRNGLCAPRASLPLHFPNWII